MINVGDRVKSACRRSHCRDLTGTLIAKRTGFYSHQVKWDQRDKPSWMSERGLETLRIAAAPPHIK